MTNLTSHKVSEATALRRYTNLIIIIIINIMIVLLFIIINCSWWLFASSAESRSKSVTSGAYI